MSRPRQVTSQDIILVARSHFLTKGHSASVNSIARDLGVSHSALIQRFGSKRQLLITALRPPTDFPWETTFLEGPQLSPLEAREQLNQVCQKLLTFLEEHLPSIRVLQAAEIQPSELFNGHLPFPLIAIQQVSGWIQRGIDRKLFRSCSPQTIATMLIGSLFARIHLQQLCEITHACKDLPNIPKSEQLLVLPNDLIQVIMSILISQNINDLNIENEEDETASNDGKGPHE